MSSNEIVTLNVTAKPQGLSTVDTSSAMIITSVLPEGKEQGTVSVYTSTNQMVEDGFAIDSDAYSIASLWFMYQSKIKVYFTRAEDTTMTIALSHIVTQYPQQSFFYCFFDKTVYQSNDEVKNIATWCEANNSYFINMPNGQVATDVIANADGTTVKELESLGLAMSMSALGKKQPYMGVSVAARQSIVPYAGTDTCITMNYKGLKGVEVDEFTATEIANLDNSKVARYTHVTGMNRLGIVKSHSKDGFDFSTVIDMFATNNSTSTAVTNIIQTSPTKLPYNTKGYQLLLNSVRRTLDLFVANGALGERLIQDADGSERISKGYDLLSNQKDILKATDEQRANGEAPLVQYTLYPLNSIKTVTISVYISQ